MNSAGEMLCLYDTFGWRLVLIPPNSKAPTAKGWQEATPEPEGTLRHVLLGGNVGLLLGPASGDVVDIDLDCREALALADLYLPPTGAVFGRCAKPDSHRLYHAPGAIYASFPDPTCGSTLLELRAPGRDGGAHQTLIPPSIADDDPRFWRDSQILPATIDAGILTRRASWLAIGCLVMRHVSEHAARRPDWDLLDLLWEADPALGRRAYRWAGELAPDERPPPFGTRGKPRRDYTNSELRLEEVCAAIVNNFDWHGWNNAGMAIYNASGGSQLGFVCFDDLSARSPKYQPYAVLERWKNYQRSPPTRIGPGTLVHLAKQSGWGPQRQRRSAA